MWQTPQQQQPSSDPFTSATLRDRVREQVSTAVFRADDTATLRTAPSWALNAPFLYQRWLFSIARRSVLAMRCFQDLSEDPARSGWVNVKGSSKHLASQHNNATQSGQGGIWCKRRSIWRAAHEKSRSEFPQAVIAALNPYEQAELQQYGASCLRLLETAPDAVSTVDAVSTFAALMDERGVALNDLAPGSHDFLKRVARRWKTASISAGGSSSSPSSSSPSKQQQQQLRQQAELYLAGAADPQAAAARLQQQQRLEAPPWPYDTSGVIWKDVFEAVRFVLGTPPASSSASSPSPSREFNVDEKQQAPVTSVVNSDKNTPSAAAATTSGGGGATLSRPGSRPPVPASADSNAPRGGVSGIAAAVRRKLIDSRGSSANTQNMQQRQQEPWSPTNRTATKQEVENRRMQIREMLEPAAATSPTSPLLRGSSPSPSQQQQQQQQQFNDARMQSCVAHWARTITAVVIATCFGDVADAQSPGARSLPEITPEFVHDVLGCVLELVSSPSTSLLHDKCITTVAAFLEFQRCFAGNSSSSSGGGGAEDPDPETINFFATELNLDQQQQQDDGGGILTPRAQQSRRSKAATAAQREAVLRRHPIVAPPFWFVAGPPFIKMSWAELDSTDLVRTFAVAFPTVSMIPGYVKPFEVSDRARLEQHIAHSKRRWLEMAAQAHPEEDPALFRQAQVDAAAGDEVVDSIDVGLKAQRQGGWNSVVSGADAFAAGDDDDGGREQHHLLPHHEYVDQVTRRRIERLRLRQIEEQRLSAAQQLAAPPTTLVSPSLSRMTACARGHRHERVVYRHSGMLPLSEMDDKEAEQLEMSLQKKAHDWVAQRPKFVGDKNRNNSPKKGARSTSVRVGTPDASTLYSLSVQPWVGAPRAASQQPRQQQRGVADGGGSLHASGGGRHVVAKAMGSQAHRQQVANAQMKSNIDAVVASSPWCLTNALPPAFRNEQGKQRALVGAPRGTGSVAREEIKKVRALTEALLAAQARKNVTRRV